MRIYSTSRRQDLLVGSLVSTIVVSLAFWLSITDLRAVPGPVRTKEPPAKRFEVPLDEEVVTTDDPLAPMKPQAPQPPDIPDAPQPVRTDSIMQPIEPPRPDSSPSDMRTIPADWSRNPGPMNEVFDTSRLDQQPVPRSQASPQYPFEMRNQGVTGEVIVDFIVDTAGNVRNARAIRGTNPDFEAAAVSAVGKWKFRPGRKANHAVFTHMQVPIEFTLADSEK